MVNLVVAEIVVVVVLVVIAALIVQQIVIIMITGSVSTSLFLFLTIYELHVVKQQCCWNCSFVLFLFQNIFLNIILLVLFCSKAEQYCSEFHLFHHKNYIVCSVPVEQNELICSMSISALLSKIRLNIQLINLKRAQNSEYLTILSRKIAFYVIKHQNLVNFFLMWNNLEQYCSNSSSEKHFVSSVLFHLGTKTEQNNFAWNKTKRTLLTNCSGTNPTTLMYIQDDKVVGVS